MKSRNPSGTQLTWLRNAIVVVLAILAATPFAAEPQPSEMSSSIETAKPERGLTPEGVLSGFSSFSPAPDRNLSQYQLSFRDLGATFPLNLRGVDGRNGVEFSIRADEVVSAAKLHLEYSYSPALLPEISQINVMINEQTIASLPVSPETEGRLQRASIEIPPHLIGDFNRANIQLIGHYALECEDSSHSSLWAIVNNDSTLEFTVQQLKLNNDLGLLPIPFFDRRNLNKLSLPIVFGDNQGLSHWEAAGILASWFGAQADFRGAEFPVSVGQLPESGNAVVIASRQDSISGITLPSPDSRTLSVVSHPNDPFSKLLVLSAPNAEELPTIAKALAMGSGVFSGVSTTISDIVEVSPRLPYDAPRWLPSNRAVSLGELVPVSALSVRGYTPETIRIPLRLPPDLFYWRSPGIPIDLTYRYTYRPSQNQSTLNISIGETFLRSYPIPSAPTNVTVEDVVSDFFEMNGKERKVKFNVPLEQLPKNTDLLFQYFYETLKTGDCSSAPLDNVEGSLDAASTIDISGFQHYMEMPDLSVFVNSGFPFTRLADLSETIVIIPSQITPDSLQAFLDLMGRMGKITGYPVLSVQLRTDSNPGNLENHDLLVLAAGSSQPLLDQWADVMPFRISGSTKRFTISDSESSVIHKVRSAFQSTEPTPNLEVVVRAADTQTLVAGFESPVTAGRSVVVFAASSHLDLRRSIEALVNPTSNIEADLYGSFAAIKQDASAETLLNRKSYTVGELSWWIGIRYYFSQHPVILLMVALFGILVLALAAFQGLRLKARSRLRQS